MYDLKVTRDNKLDLKYMIPKYLTKVIIKWADIQDSLLAKSS